MKFPRITISLILALAIFTSPAIALLSENSRQGHPPISAVSQPAPTHENAEPRRGLSLALLEIMADSLFGFNGGNNLFAYANSNPLRFRDPWGLRDEILVFEGKAFLGNDGIPYKGPLTPDEIDHFSESFGIRDTINWFDRSQSEDQFLFGAAKYLQLLLLYEGANRLCPDPTPPSSPGVRNVPPRTAFSKTWESMTESERGAFQHAYDRHAQEFGLPRWSHRNAEFLRNQFNQAVQGVRDNGILYGRRNVPYGIRGEGVPGSVTEVNVFIHTDSAGKTFYYYETRSGTFISSGELK